MMVLMLFVIAFGALTSRRRSPSCAM